jgi:hypothetical protein
VIASKARCGPIPLRWAYGRSAGTVLRSQGTLGPVGLSRFRARGIRVSTFLCSLRSDPAPLWRIWALRGNGPARAEEARERRGLSRVARGVFVVRLQGSLRTDPAPLGVWGAPRDRSCARRERWGRLGFRAFARGGSGCRRSYARSGPIPLRFGVFGRSAGTVLRSLRRLWGGWGFRALRAGVFVVRLQGSLRTDPAPLGVWGAPRERSCARTLAGRLR